MLTEIQLRSILSWTRCFHEAVEGFAHSGPWRFFDVGAPTLIAHNDIAPYNICFDGDSLVGVFDWDLAGPSTPLLELARDILSAVPYRIQLMLEGIPVAAAAGDEGMANLMAGGEPPRSERPLAELVSRIPSIAAHLD